MPKHRLPCINLVHEDQQDSRGTIHSMTLYAIRLKPFHLKPFHWMQVIDNAATR